MKCEFYELAENGDRQYCGRPAYRPSWDITEHKERCSEHYPWKWEYEEGSLVENLDVPIDHPDRFMVTMRLNWGP